MTSLVDPERFVALEGCGNFRDLGGYPVAGGGTVRWRHLYRSGFLGRLEPGDLTQLQAIGLRTVVDLRTPGEVAQAGSCPAELGAAVVQAALADVVPGSEDAPAWRDPTHVAARYDAMLAGAGAVVAATLDRLAQPRNLPAVFHCSIGKDRTGVLAAVVLGCLGVPDDVIVEDYVLSREPAMAFLAWLRAEYPDQADAVERVAPVVTSVEAETMEGLLLAVRRRHGSFDGLAAAIGASEAVSRLRGLLVE